MKPRILQWTIVIVIALMAMMPFVACEPGSTPYDQSFEISQSAGVSASGTVTFTYDGTVIGGPYNVHCPELGYHSYYVFTLPKQPNDISWSINITWADETQENWQGQSLIPPREYVKEHNSSSVSFSV